MDTLQGPTLSPSGQARQRFIDNGDGTIIDVQKRLVWCIKDSWQETGKWMSWSQLRDYAGELNRKKFAGYSNWRLPTTAEAKSLYDKTHQNKDHMGQPARLPSIFPPGFGFLCWTAEVKNKIQAIRFGFRKGVGSFDDIYRVSRGATRFVRDFETE